jgi:hypothetical protein
VPARHQRRTGDDAPCRGLRFPLHRVIRHDARQQALGIGLGGIQQAPFEQDFLRHRRPGQLEKTRQLAGIHRETQPHDRRAELRTLAGDAQVAGTGDFQPAANAGAEDRGQRRMRAGLDRGQRRAHRLVVGQRQIDIGARGLELLEVAAGGEGRTLAAQDHAAQGSVGRQFGHGFTQAPPHQGIQRIQLVGVEQGDGGDVAVALAEDVGVHVSRASACNGCLSPGSG